MSLQAISPGLSGSSGRQHNPALPFFLACMPFLGLMARGKNMASDNSILIGSKPFMNYVTGVVIQFTAKNMPEVIVKARGKFISRAVDVAEVASKRFLNDSVMVKNIVIGSEGFKNSEGRDVRVSSIEIVLGKK